MYRKQECIVAMIDKREEISMLCIPVISEKSTKTHIEKTHIEPNWDEIYIYLNRIMPSFVYRMHVPSWRGQEEEIVADIIQETMQRLVERIWKAEQGQAEPIYALKYMAIIIAQNYCRDIARHDYRLLHQEEIRYFGGRDEEDSLDKATEQVYRNTLFTLLAHNIARFPAKQRRALLIDLANRTHFGAQADPLEEAFLAAGISLRAYQLPIGDALEERARHYSLLSCAYKRMAKLPEIRAYVDDRWIKSP